MQCDVQVLAQQLTKCETSLPNNIRDQRTWPTLLRFRSLKRNHSPTCFRSVGVSRSLTGGTRGIGAAIVRRMAQAGASVVVTGRGKPALKEIEAEIGAMGGSAIGVQADAGSVR